MNDGFYLHNLYVSQLPMGNKTERSQSMAYRVLVVEDQEMPRQLFEIFINSSDNYLHVGSVANAGLALSMCRQVGLW